MPDTAVRLSYTGNPDNIIGESGTDGDGISIFNDLRTPPIEYSKDSLEVNDPRRAVQIPNDVISAGLTPNPR